MILNNISVQNPSFVESSNRITESMPTSRREDDNEDVVAGRTTTLRPVKRRRTTAARVSTTDKEVDTVTESSHLITTTTSLQPTPTYDGDYESVDKHKVSKVLSELFTTQSMYLIKCV